MTAAYQPIKFNIIIKGFNIYKSKHHTKCFNKFELCQLLKLFFFYSGLKSI